MTSLLIQWPATPNSKPSDVRFPPIAALPKLARGAPLLRFVALHSAGIAAPDRFAWSRIGRCRPLRQAPGKEPLVHPLEQKIRHEADHADHDDAEDDLACIQESLAVGDHVADAGRRAEQFGDD